MPLTVLVAGTCLNGQAVAVAEATKLPSCKRKLHWKIQTLAFVDEL